MISYKETTKESYAATAAEFAGNVAALAPTESIQRFVDLLPAQAKIIDIGCGSGRDANLFTQKGISVLGIDFCQNLIDIAKKHAPLAEFQLMDFETAVLPASSFEGAWACCSLCHIPKKGFPAALSKVHDLLKENGYFYLSLKQGTGEVFEKDTRYHGDIEKFWSFFEENELKEIVESAKFKILDCAIVEKKVKYHTHPGIRLFCQKN